MKRLFIINPKSGAKRGGVDSLKAAIKKHFPSADIALTNAPGHAKELAKQNYDQITACGGDGTINEIVQSLAGTKTALGIIPLGSGNGLARELGAPLDNFEAACNNILKACPARCDLGRANGEYFVNLAGLGLEADIAAAFDKQSGRGKWPYFKIGARKFLSYKAPQVSVEIDGGETINTRPLTLVFSNGRQYGSGFKIAPQASFGDGLLDMVYIENKGILRHILCLPNFFKPGISPCETRKFHKIKKAVARLEGGFNYHIDGEPRRAKDLLEIEIAPGAIYLL